MAESPGVGGGTGLAYDRAMVRWAGVGSVVIVAMIVVLSRLDAVPQASDAPLRQGPASSPAGDTAPPAAPGSGIDRSVIIEHQVIEVPTPTPTARPRLRAVSPARRASAGSGRDLPVQIASRARRILVGDGRYRPEPFPRPASIR